MVQQSLRHQSSEVVCSLRSLWGQLTVTVLEQTYQHHLRGQAPPVYSLLLKNLQELTCLPLGPELQSLKAEHGASPHYWLQQDP